MTVKSSADSYCCKQDGEQIELSHKVDYYILVYSDHLFLILSMIQSTLGISSVLYLIPYLLVLMISSCLIVFSESEFKFRNRFVAK